MLIALRGSLKNTAQVVCPIIWNTAGYREQLIPIGVLLWRLCNKQMSAKVHITGYQSEQLRPV